MVQTNQDKTTVTIKSKRANGLKETNFEDSQFDS